MKFAGYWIDEEYPVSFIKNEDGHICIAEPSEDILSTAVCLTDLPVCSLLVPDDIEYAEHYLIAHANPSDVDPTYGENEAYIEVTYSEDEHQTLLMMFDAK